MPSQAVQYEIYLITTPGYWYVGSTTVGAHKRFGQHLYGSRRLSGARFLHGHQRVSS